jgi:hypothetical protein
MPVLEIFYPALAALVSTVQNIFFLTAHILLYVFTVFPMPSNLGGQSRLVACLLLCVSACKYPS